MKSKNIVWPCIILFVIILLGIFAINIRTDIQPEPIHPTIQIFCGDNICSKNETKKSCPSDCDEITCRDFYTTIEEKCIKNGWGKISLVVDGIEREILWKAPNV